MRAISPWAASYESTSDATYKMYPNPVYCCDRGNIDASEASAESDDESMNSVGEDSNGDTP
jgi:hypothetical protein